MINQTMENDLTGTKISWLLTLSMV